MACCGLTISTLRATAADSAPTPPAPAGEIAADPTGDDWYAPSGSGEASFIGEQGTGSPRYLITKSQLVNGPITFEIMTDAARCTIVAGAEQLTLPIIPGVPNRLTLDGRPDRPRLELDGGELHDLQAAWIKLLAAADDQSISLEFVEGTYANLTLNPADPTQQPPPTRDDLTPAGPSVTSPDKEVAPRDVVLSDPALIAANRATAWSSGRARRLLLEDDVAVSIGRYGFRADRAVVTVEPRLGSDPLVHDLTFYLDNARPQNRGSAIQADAPRLLVTASTTGDIQLVTNLLTEQATAPGDALVAEADDQNKRRPQPDSYAVAWPPPPPPTRQPTDTTITSGQPPAQTDSTPLPDPKPPARPGTAETAQQPIDENEQFDGAISFVADKIVYRETDSDEKAVILSGCVRVVFERAGSDKITTLSASNAVVFLDTDSSRYTLTRSASYAEARGVYLEGSAIATDGQYTVRAPRVFYDPSTERAVVLNAVFYTWDARRQAPIYLRADQLRQIAEDSWSSHNARLSTSEFAVPHFAIGAGDLTIHREPTADEAPQYRFTARDTSLRWNDTPLFFWPTLAGQTTDSGATPLNSINIGFSRDDGPTVRTDWDLFALAGREGPRGVDLSGQFDYLGEHGAATGINLDYNLSHMSGQLDSYLVLHDTGDDEIGSRFDLDRDGDTRGYLLWRHRQALQNDWDVSIEFGFVSDETFLDEFFLDQAETSKPYETSVYLKKQQDDWAFTFLASYDLNDFTAQTTTLQAPGYTVSKAPELGYHQIGTSFWDDRLTYFSQSRLGRVRIQAGSDDAANRGFLPFQSMRLFGLPNTTNFDTALRAAGVPLNYRTRLDTRHEVQAPMRHDHIDVIPYAAGRLTAYDDDFTEFSGNDDRSRLWATVGVRLHTQLTRVYDRIKNRTLDLNRLRHIIAPSADVFWSGSTLDAGDAPIYDADVEGIQEGFGMRIGVTNTLQTQRGAPGRERSVDWIVLDTDLVLRSSDADTTTAIARFFDYRPEYSRGGDHLHNELRWMHSDTFATVAEWTYNLESDFTPQWRLGAILDHTPDLTTYLDYAEIDALGSRLLGYGFSYRLTRKYDLGFRHTLDLGTDSSRSVELTLHRKLPHWRLVVVARHDNIDDEQTIGISLIPEGLAPSRRGESHSGGLWQ